MTLQEAIKLYSLVELYNSKEFINICTDEYDIVDDELHFNEDPCDDVELRCITRVWNYNEETQGFDLVWEKEHDK